MAVRQAEVGKARPARPLLGWLAFGAVLAVLLALLCRPGALLGRLELHALDSRFALRGALPLGDDVAIVAIDEKSMSQPELGRWPWDRLWQSRLVDELARHKPLAIAFDVLFSEPQRQDVWQDQAFAASLARAGNVVLAAHATEKPPAAPGTALEKAPQPGLVVGQNLAPSLPGVVPPLASLAAAAAAIGILATWPDQDGAIRRAALVVAAGQPRQFYATFPLVAAARGMRWDFGQMRFNLRSSAQLHPALHFALDGAGGAIINYLGPPGTIPQYSFVDVVRGKVPGDAFRGKVVLIGLTAPGLGDYYPTPTGEMFGVEIQAHTIADLLHGNFLEPAGLPTDVGLALVLALLGVVAAAWLRPLLGLATVVTLGVAYLAGGAWLFNHGGVIWPLLAPSLALVLSYAGVAVFRLSTEEAGRRHLRAEFGRYAPPKVVERLDAGEMESRSAGTVRTVTALFADVRGFTEWSSGTDPREVVLVLNRYFEAMTELAFDLEGAVDNIVGDEIFVTFNVLEDQPDQCDRAVHLAVNMIAALDGLNERWLEGGTLSQPMRIGVGINTGEALVGNLGSRIRTQYTCLGQAVNLASRLQSLNKDLGTTILASAEVVDQLEDSFVVVDRGEQEVRGHPVPVHVYEIAGRPQETTVVPPADTGPTPGGAESCQT